MTEDSDFEFKNNDQNGDGYVTWKEIVGETDSNEDDENVITLIQLNTIQLL